jgi:hypothetical protein
VTTTPGAPFDPFAFRSPDPEENLRLKEITAALRVAYETLLRNSLGTPERTLAVRKLEEAAFWAYKAIVQRGERYPPI